MNRRLRIDVVDDDAGVVFVLDVCGDVASDDLFEEGRQGGMVSSELAFFLETSFSENDQREVGGRTGAFLAEASSEGYGFFVFEFAAWRPTGTGGADGFLEAG